MEKTHLLLLHGALGSCTQFDQFVPLLSPQFTIHKFDFEGHGNGESRDRPFRIEHFAENTLEYLNRHNVSQTHAFGYSMGGYVALYLALTHQDRVGRIATLATKFRWSPEVALQEATSLDPRTISEKLPRFAAVLKDRHALHTWEKVLQRTTEMMSSLGNAPLLTDRELKQIKHPVRVCVGDRDTMVGIEESVEAYRQLPYGELMVLPNTPHPFEKVPLDLLSQSLIKFFV